MPHLMADGRGNPSQPASFSRPEIGVLPGWTTPVLPHGVYCPLWTPRPPLRSAGRRLGSLGLCVMDSGMARVWRRVAYMFHGCQAPLPFVLLQKLSRDVIGASFCQEVNDTQLGRGRGKIKVSPANRRVLGGAPLGSPGSVLPVASCLGSILGLRNTKGKMRP